jgi:hypothetical protein
VPMRCCSPSGRGGVVRKAVRQAKPSNQLWEQEPDNGERGSWTDCLPGRDELRGWTHPLAGQPHQPRLEETLVWGDSDQQQVCPHSRSLPRRPAEAAAWSSAGQAWRQGLDAAR